MSVGAATADHPIEAQSDDWVLRLSLNGPGRSPCDEVRWAEWGNLRGFLAGKIFDRLALTRVQDLNDKPRSSIELILRAYAHEGEEILSRLRGSFVLAIIDRGRDLAIVARDALGSHPLFYTETGSSVAFAATPRALLELPGVSRGINRAALADHLCDRWPDPQETFFSAVCRVPPGCKTIINNGRIRFERHWQPAPPDRPIDWLNENRAGQFEKLFERSVDRCVGDQIAGIFLSGGLDSISVAAFAADRARRNGEDLPKALSLGFTDPECNEQDRQVAVAQSLGLPQHLITFEEAVGSRPLLEQSLELNQHLSSPLLNAWAPAYLALAKLGKRDGVQTILSGQGGDEWLTVTPFLSADLIAQGAFRELANFFQVLLRSHNLDAFALARNSLWRCGLRPLGGRLLHRIAPRSRKTSRLKRLLAGDPVWVAPENDLRLEQRRRAESALSDPDPPQGFYARELQLGLDHSLVSWESEEQYELGRQVGVSFSHPFQDQDVVEMLYRTPPRILNEGGRTKGLVRRALARRFPGLDLERQRKVLALSLFQSTVWREVPTIACKIGDFPALSALGIVDGERAGAAIRDDLNSFGSRIHRVWATINLEAWTQSHAKC